METGNRGGSESARLSKSPLWLSLEADPPYKGNGKGVAENWSWILRENASIAELLTQCSQADDLTALLNLLEQLHSGRRRAALLCREGALR